MALYRRGEAEGQEGHNSQGSREGKWNAAPIPLSIVDKKGDLDLQSENEADLWPVSQ